MSNLDTRNPAGMGSPAPPIVTPHYGASPGNPSDIEGARNTRCITGFGFITSIHGILNIVIIVAVVCVLISAGVANNQDGKAADDLSFMTNAKVSAFHTRNAVLVFAVFVLVLILADTILHITGIINRLPAIFDLAFIIIMLVLGGIYFILGCCAAAWEQKMRDTLGVQNKLMRPGAAASASFFLFVAMIAIFINFILRLVRPVTHV